MGYRIYLLDEYGQPVMPGQPGEIVIGGESFGSFQIMCKRSFLL
jgi:hypothetical protein